MLRTTATLAAFLLIAQGAEALEPPILMKESAGRDAAPGQQGCPLEPNLTGDCANLKYYNLCSGYIWIYGWGADDQVGVRFDGSCINATNRVETAITYFRNVCPGYSQTFDIYLDVDTDNDGCPEYNMSAEPRLDPALRWNCSSFDMPCIPSDARALVLRVGRSEGTSCGGLATDGPFSETCDPIGSPHSYYYGLGGGSCVPWQGANGRFDNFLFWLIVDSGCTTSTEQTSWGAVKGLFK